MNDAIAAAVDELTTLTNLLSLLTLTAGSFDPDQSRPLIAGLDLAITLISDVQNSLDEIGGQSAMRHAA